MIVLVTGGARSGKSTFAESIYKGLDDVVYIAAARAEDDEMRRRISLHRSSRPSRWRTFEGSYGLEAAIGPEKHYLLECITVLISNIMFDMSAGAETIDCELQKLIEDKALQTLRTLAEKIREQDKDLVMVTNEVGFSVVPDNHLARVYIDIAGRVNRRMAGMADEVYAVFCGIPLRLK